MNSRVEAALGLRSDAKLRPLLVLEMTRCPPTVDKPAQVALLDGLADLRRVLNTSTVDNATEQAERFLLNHRSTVETSPDRAALVCIESADTTTAQTSSALRQVVHAIADAAPLREALSVTFEDTLARALGGEPPSEKQLHGTVVLLTDADLLESWRRITIDTPALTVLVLGRELAARGAQVDTAVADEVADDPRTSRCNKAQLYNTLEQICLRPVYGSVTH